jgi:hypothetical protein
MHSRYEIGDKVIIHSIGGENAHYNGTTGYIERPIGFSRAFPTCYGVVCHDGKFFWIEDDWLFPKLPILNRGDMDTKVTWEQFYEATGNLWKKRPEDLT